jgi:hypothetical protein
MVLHVAESISCEGICEPIATLIGLAYLVLGAVYLCVLFASCLLFWRTKKTPGYTHSKKRWVWRVWLALLAVPPIVFVISLILP